MADSLENTPIHLIACPADEHHSVDIDQYICEVCGAEVIDYGEL